MLQFILNQSETYSASAWNSLKQNIYRVSTFKQDKQTIFISTSKYWTLNSGSTCTSGTFKKKNRIHPLPFLCWLTAMYAMHTVYQLLFTAAINTWMLSNLFKTHRIAFYPPPCCCLCIYSYVFICEAMKLCT